MDKSVSIGGRSVVRFCGMLGCIFVFLCFARNVIAGAPSQQWAKLQDVRSLQVGATAQDWPSILQQYDALLLESSGEDVLRYEIMYWKSRALYESGSLIESRTLMAEAANHYRVRNQALAFLVQSGAWEHRVMSLPFEGDFLVNQEGILGPKSSLVWHGAFDLNARDLNGIELRCESQVYPLTLTVELLDWRNEAWVWRGTVKDSEGLELTPRDFRQPRVQDQTFFRAITISAESFDGRAVSIEVERLKLR